MEYVTYPKYLESQSLNLNKAKDEISTMRKSQNKVTKAIREKITVKSLSFSQIKQKNQLYQHFILETSLHIIQDTKGLVSNRAMVIRHVRIEAKSQMIVFCYCYIYLF